MERPVIGIMGNTYMTQPGMFDSMERAYQNSYYVNAVMKNGGSPCYFTGHLPLWSRQRKSWESATESCSPAGRI